MSMWLLLDCECECGSKGVCLTRCWIAVRTHSSTTLLTIWASYHACTRWGWTGYVTQYVCTLFSLLHCVLISRSWWLCWWYSSHSDCFYYHSSLFSLLAIIIMMMIDEQVVLTFHCCSCIVMSVHPHLSLSPHSHTPQLWWWMMVSMMMVLRLRWKQECE